MTHLARLGLALVLGLTSSFLFNVNSHRSSSTHTAVYAAAPSQARQPDPISPELRTVLAATPAGERVRVIVRMQTSPFARSALDATESLDRQQARATQVSILQAEAQAAQAGLLSYLSAPQVAAQTDEVRTFWIFNGLSMRTTPGVIAELAQRSDVESIRPDEWVKADYVTASITETLRAQLAQGLPEITPGMPISFSRQPRVAALASSPPGPGEVTWGVARIGADQVWRGLGVTGQGVVVANVDGGVDWQHPALQSRYRGYSGGPVADHMHNWFDATGDATTYPTDLDGHGTHTMGTMVGDGGIGVAPGAKWMAARALNGSGIGLSSWIHSAFQFILAPGGDPSFAPDIVNNSWGSTSGGSQEFKEDLAALRRAGIFVVFSNGNAGPDPQSVSSPASNPGAIGIGATDAEDGVAYFSGRGPSPIDNAIKPTLSAPGVDVVSAFPGGGFASSNGTSMAAPHVAGAAALLLSVAPTLSITATLFAITSTAKPLAQSVPNNDSGWGRLDAYRAVLTVLPSGAIVGTVRDESVPIGNASVVATDGATGRQAWTTTDAAGRYSLRVSSGIYTVEAGAFGYITATSAPPQLVVTGSVATIDLSLTYLPSGSVRGTVRDAATGAYITATVRALGTPKVSLSNNNCLPCRYALDLPAGDYTLEVRAVGYLMQTRQVSLADGALVDENFSLTATQRVALVDSGAFYYGSLAPYYREALDALRISYDEYRIKDVLADTPTITQLLKYDSVIWSAPFDSPGVVGASDTISRFLGAGRNLLLAGESVALYDGGGLFSYQPYFSRINAVFKGFAINPETIIGAPGGPIAGTVISAANPSAFFTPDVVDIVQPDTGRIIANYDAGANGFTGAGVFTNKCTRFRSAYYTFNLNREADPAARADIISRTLGSFTAPRPQYGVELLSRDGYLTDVGVGPAGSVVTHALRLRNTGDGGITQTFTLETSGNQWPGSLTSGSVVLGPCATANITLTVNVPNTAGWNASDSLTVTAFVQSAPSERATISFTTKTPAGILLVDDDRFFNREQDYIAALGANGNIADRWDTRGSVSLAYSPPITSLRMYPVVIWFNGYDWFDPIAATEERALRQYLDGGGRLFFTSQAALAYTGLSQLTTTYFGVGDIDFTDVTSNLVSIPGTPLGNGSFGGTLLPFPYNWNLSTAVQPISGTAVFLRGDSSQPFGLAREEPLARSFPPLGRPAWRTVLAPFAFEALQPGNRVDLLNRIVGWLTPLGKSSLSADRATASPGEVVNFTLVMRADQTLPASLGISHPVTLAVDLAPGLALVSSSLQGASGQTAGAWASDVTAGETLTWTFAARVDASGPVTATARFGLTGAGLRFSCQAVVRPPAPSLQTSLEVAPRSAAWGSSVTVTLRITNTSDLAAPNAVITAVVPPSLSITSLATAVLPDMADAGTANAATDATRMVIKAGLPPRGSYVTQYRIILPRFNALALEAYDHAVIVDDGAGNLTPASVWLAPRTTRLRYPLLPK
jgi:subtilisin family serine protease